MNLAEFMLKNSQMNCKICDSEISKIFEEKILDKYVVDYFHCISCGFIQTEEPYWISEAYNSAIANMDTGLLERNQKIALVLPLLIKTHFNKYAKFLDYGAGYGVLVRLMRDKNLDFYWQDYFCENIFSKGFDVEKLSKEEQKFELITAFEVFEHMVNPVEELEKILSYGESILFSTNLIPNKFKAEVEPEKLKSWWYLSQETGQHTSLYTQKALEKLGKKFDLNFYTNGYNLHLFTRKKINPIIFKILNLMKILKDTITSTNDLKGPRLDREIYKPQSKL